MKILKILFLSIAIFIFFKEPIWLGDNASKDRITVKRISFLDSGIIKAVTEHGLVLYVPKENIKIIIVSD